MCGVQINNILVFWGTLEKLIFFSKYEVTSIFFALNVRWDMSAYNMQKLSNSNYDEKSNLLFWASLNHELFDADL